MKFARTSCKECRVFLVFNLPHRRCYINAGPRKLQHIVYPCGFTLYWAAYFNRWAETETLINLGSNVNFRQESPNTSVLTWIMLGLFRQDDNKRGHLLELALSAGADPNWISDGTIRRVLMWDRETRHIVTREWSQDTVNRATRLTGLPDLAERLHQ